MTSSMKNFIIKQSCFSYNKNPTGDNTDLHKIGVDIRNALDNEYGWVVNVISRLSVFLRKYWFVLLEPHCQGTFNQDITIYKSAGTFLEFSFNDVSLQYFGFNLVFLFISW